MERLILSNDDVYNLAQQAAQAIAPLVDKRRPTVYAIPRGGIPAMYAMRVHRTFDVVDTPEEADYIVDDIIDSGETMRKALDRAATTQGDVTRAAVGVALIDHRNPQFDEIKGKWIVFPWEGDAEGGLEDNVRRILEFVGEDVNRPGLLETPRRVAEAWEFWCKGYGEDPAEILKTFTDGAERCDEMVVVKDIPFYTHCEHHMTPFFGTATIAYVPNGKIVGLSKLNRVLDCYARRLQVQERLTCQVADAIYSVLEPKGVGVIVKARHLCMESRGVCQQGHHTVTSALRGVMRSDATARQEFLSLAR